MILTDLPPIFHALTLSLVAGVPLLFAVGCCTSFSTQVGRLLPWAIAPALLAALTVPGDVIVEVPWFFMGGRMGLDETGSVFLRLTAFIWFLAALSIRSDCKETAHLTRFHGFFLTAMAGNFGLILSQDILGFYLFFALMSFAVYGLIVHTGTQKARNAGRIYLILVMIGEIALFTALILLVHRTGSLAIEDIATSGCLPALFVLLFVGFGVKVGALPLHGWMIPAYQTTPVPVAAALAGAMVNAGILGWLRFLPPDGTTCSQGATLFIIAGALSSVYGVLVGLNQQRPGAILACSSISQMGLITLLFGLGLFNVESGRYTEPVLILYVVHHALAKSSLFFGYDFLRNRRGRVSLLCRIGVLLPALSLAGLPLTSGAIGKIAFKDLATTLGEPWQSWSLFFLPITALGTTLLMFHFMHILQTTETTLQPGRTRNAHIWLVSVIAVALPLWLWPAADQYAAHSLHGYTIWQCLWPVVCGFSLFVGWQKIKKSGFVPRRGQDQPHREPFKLQLNTVLQGPLFLEGWRKRREQKTSQVKAAILPALRKVENILGRWIFSSLLYLALCLGLFFFLL